MREKRRRGFWDEAFRFVGWMDRQPDEAWFLFGAWSLFMAAMTLNLLSCDPNGLRMQASVANTTASGFNRVVRPTLLQAYESGGEARLTAACPSPPCSREQLLSVFREYDRGWTVVFATYEVAKVAHDAWRRELERCRQRPEAEHPICSPMVERMARDFVDVVVTYRCAVRDVGRADLDPLPGEPTCPARNSPPPSP